ncbi:hypothetical protein ABPG72_012348 [Tetrahymena utriculariae]
MKQSIQKETELLKNKLSSYLKDFQKITDWPSVNNWLLKLEQAFKDHPTPYLEDKLVLAKRLSQCLNHNLPVGTHKSTLTVYKLIFNNLKLINDIDDSPDSVRKHISKNLHIFSLGLFPFFSGASAQLKPDILDIIETHFCPLETDLIPCSVGLIVSILPGVVENNEEIQRKTFQVFEQLQVKIGKKYLYGALWLSILRLPRTRVAAFTCLSKLFKKNDQQNLASIDIEPHIIKKLQQSNQFTQEEVFFQQADETAENYSPFVKVYEQQRKLDLGVRSVDDQHLEEDNIFNEQEVMLQNINEIKNQDDFKARFPNKSALILNALVQTLEDENNQTKKFGLDFLLSYFPILGDPLSKFDKLVLTQCVLYLFLKSEYSIVWKCHQWLFGEADINSNFQIGEHNRVVINYFIKNALINIFDHSNSDLNAPIKIIQTFYMKNNHMIAESLKTISFYLIKYIKQHFENQEVQKSSLRLFECVYNYFDVIFSSFCDHYDELIKQSQQNQTRKDFYFNEKVYTLELIEFTFIKMFVYHSEMEFSELSKTIQPLISRLVSYLSDEVSNVIDDQHSILLRCIFQLPEYLRKILEELEKSGSDIQLLQMDETYAFYVQIFEKYYLRLCYLLTETLNEEKEQKKQNKTNQIELLIDPLASKLPSQNLANQQHQNQQNQLQQQVSNRLSEQLRKEIEDQAEITQKRYEECLYNIFDQSSKIIISLHKLYLGYYNWQIKFDSTPEWIKKIYQIIEITKQYFPKIELFCIDSLIEIITYKCKHQDRFNLLQCFVEEDSKITQITKILWSNLELSNQQKRIIDYLVILMNKFPKLFTNVVESSFKQNNSIKLQSAMKGFMTFYRMTNNYITKNSSSNLGCGLFQMLDLLSNKNPILRNVVKTFLMENTALLFRVLDPFLIEFLECQHNCRVQYKYSNLFIYEESYDCQRILYLIKLLESTLEILKDIFVSYIFSVKISSHLSNKIKASKFYNQFDLSNATYMDVICNIMVRFIQGQTPLDLLENRKEALSISLISSDDEEEGQEREENFKGTKLNNQISGDNLESPKLTQKQHSKRKREQAHGEQFRLENQQINSLCSEYLDKLIQYAEKKSTAIKILNLTLEKILITLKFLIQNNNLIIQVELINLIQSIIMKFKQIHKKKSQADQIQSEPQVQQQQQNQSSLIQNQRISSVAQGGLKIAEECLRNAIEMFGSQLFFSNLLEGFELSEDPFVRSRYIYVITIGIWTLSDAFSEESLKDIVTLIFVKYYAVLKSVKMQDIIQSTDLAEEGEFSNKEEIQDLSISAAASILQSNLKENYFTRDRAQQGGLYETDMGFEYQKGYTKNKSIKKRTMFLGKNTQNDQDNKSKKNLTQKKNSQTSQNLLDVKKESISNQKKNIGKEEEDIDEDDYLKNEQEMNLSSQFKCQEIRNICDSIKSILNYFLQFKDSNGVTFVSLQNIQSPTKSISQAINQQQQHYKMASALYDIITLKFLNSNALMSNSNNPNSQNSQYQDRFSYLPQINIQNNSTSVAADSRSSSLSQTNIDPLSQLNLQCLKDKQHPAACNQIMLELPNLITSYLNCWSLSSNTDSNLIFNRQGTKFYNFLQFEGYNQRLQKILNYLSDSNNDFLFQDLIKVEILSVIYPLTQQFPIQTLHAFLQIWIKQCDSSFFVPYNQRDRSQSANLFQANQTANSLIYNQHYQDNQETVMTKIIEIISYMNVKIDYIIASLIKSPIIQSIRNYYIQRLQMLKDQALINSQIAQEESQILFFLFELISYQYLDLTSSQNQQIISSFWFQLVSFLSTFNTSKHPTTCIWVLDIILAASRKYSPKEILNEKNIRQDLHELIKIHLTNLANFSIQKIQFNSTTERNFTQQRSSIAKQSQKSQQTDQPQQQPFFELFAPFSPTINELFDNYQSNFNTNQIHDMHTFDGNTSFSNSDGQKNQQQAESDQLNQNPIYYEIEKNIFQISQSTNQTEDLNLEERSSSFCSNYSFSSSSANSHPLLTRDQYSFKISLLSYKTLKSLLYEVLQNCFDSQQKILQTAKDILGMVISKAFSEKKNSNHQLILVECASDLCNRLLTQSPDFIMKEFRKNLLEIFTSNDFFKCNIRILNYWRSIINWLDESGNLFTEFFERESFFQSLLSKSEETNLKIRKFQRICFIIYSGRQDKYHKQLTLLLENIGDVIKKIQNQSHELLILVLFCLRILILRLSPRVLNELLRNTWPILLTLLLQIFDKNNKLQSSSQYANQILGSTFASQQQTNTSQSPINPNLVLAALKLIEQISYVQLEEFYLHQWMFLLDYFGIQIQAHDGQLNNNNQHISSCSKQKGQINLMAQNTSISEEKLISPFSTVPLLTSYFPSLHKVDYQNKLLEDDVCTDVLKKSRKIIFTQSHVEDIEEIQSKILFFCQYIINLNQQRWNVDLKQLESIIECDFIDFDLYIYCQDKGANKKQFQIQHL